MTNQKYRFLLLSILLSGLTATSHAETLRGKHYLGSSVGITKFGNDLVDETLDLGYNASSIMNLNLCRPLDLTLGGGYSWADGTLDGVGIDTSALALGAGLVYSLRPGATVNPYLGAGLSLVNSELDLSILGQRERRESTDLGFDLGAGIEWEATDRILLRLDSSYWHLDGEDEVTVSQSTGYWLNDRVLGRIGLGYAFDSENSSATLGALVTL